MLAKGFVFIAVGFLCLAPLTAESQVFQDDFDGTALNPAVWSVDVGTGGQVVVADGVVTVTCTGNVFPFATTMQDPFPPGDFLVSVRMRYNTVVQAGDGFGALGMKAPAVRFSFGRTAADCSSKRVVRWSIWVQDRIRSITSTNGPTSTAVMPLPSMAQLSRSMIAQCAPTSLFFGHSHPIIAGPPWTSFEIDYVRVEPTGATPTQKMSWGKVKAAYR